jgi:hypothetical protein
MAELRTLGLSGFDRDEEAAFRALFDATAVPGWSLVHEREAGALLIDVDSIYGQMGWLQAQGSGRPVAACTVAMRANADFVLRRPLTAEGLATLLQELETAVPPKHVSGVSRAVGAAPAASSTAVPAQAPQAPPPATEQKAAEPAPASTEAAPPTAPAPPASVETPPTPPPAPIAAPTPVARKKRLHDFLEPGALPGPVRLVGAEPLLAFDPNAFTYAGGQSLKPLVVHCTREIAVGDWQAVTAAEYTALKNEAGGTQPMARLRWLAALCAFDGVLGPGLVGAERFKLTKWPQSEREFPRHFKIATALLKQFCSLDELAATSGASRAEVADFINACHAISMIEAEGQPVAAASDPKSGGGLMNRIRGR